MSDWEAPGMSDEWSTPKYIFDAMAVHFDQDVAAPFEGPRHVPATNWISKGLVHSPWKGFIWMNPPFGGRNGILPWLEKFVAHENGVALTPDRTSAPWFQYFAHEIDSALFLSPKVKFERPDGSLGRSPSCGTVLFAIGSQGRIALRNAKKLGWLVEMIAT